jgi:hypothetical protein
MFADAMAAQPKTVVAKIVIGSHSSGLWSMSCSLPMVRATFKEFKYVPQNCASPNGRQVIIVAAEIKAIPIQRIIVP